MAVDSAVFIAENYCSSNAVIAEYANIELAVLKAITILESYLSTDDGNYAKLIGRGICDSSSIKSLIAVKSLSEFLDFRAFGEATCYGTKKRYILNCTSGLSISM